MVRSRTRQRAGHVTARPTSAAARVAGPGVAGPRITAEASPAYDSGPSEPVEARRFPSDASPADVGPPSTEHLRATFGRIDAALEQLNATDLDLLDDRTLERAIAGIQRRVDRVTTQRDRFTGVLRRRAVATAGPGREGRADRTVQRRLAKELRLSPGEAKRVSEAGRTLTDHPNLADAADAGQLRPEQSTLIGKVLRDVPAEHVATVEAHLLEAAGDQDAVELGRTARRLLAQLDQDAAVAAENRRHARRRAAVRQESDGTVELHASLSGLDAEVMCTAIDAFRTPDPRGGPGRTTDQRTADALVAALRASLDLGRAPTDRQVKPHVMITVANDDLAADTGVAELPWTGPQPVPTVRRLTGDATIHVIGLDDVKLPISMSKGTDNPTAAQYLALAYRDGGCRYGGCTAPASWCDVAHARARRKGGLVHLGNALLLCRAHHRLIDLGGWDIVIDGWDATFTHPDGRSRRARPARGQPPDRGDPSRSDAETA